jgi:hypothetical protein
MSDVAQRHCDADIVAAHCGQCLPGSLHGWLVRRHVRDAQAEAHGVGKVRVLELMHRARRLRC